MTTVDVLDFVTNTHAEVGTGAVLLDINDGTDFCLDEIEFPIPKPSYEWRDPAHGQGRDVSYFKYQNREITLHLNVFGATENDLSDNFRALLDLLNGEEPILEWWPDGWTDPLYFDLISPPLEINTPDWFETWIRENKQMHVLSNVEIKVEAKPFARAKEETVVLGTDLSVSKIVVPPASFKGDFPAPADIYVSKASGDRWTDLIIGQRIKYSASFDPVQEPITGANVADADRLSDDYQVIDPPVNLLAALNPSFETFGGSGDTTDWTDWTETRSFTTNPYCGVQLSASTPAYDGSWCAQVMADNDAELCVNNGFETWDSDPYPNADYTGWTRSGNVGQGAGRSGSNSALLDTAAYLESTAYIPIDPTQVYRLTCWATGGNSMDLECRCYTAAPAYISSITTHIVNPGGWNSFGGDITTFPAGTTQIKIRLTGVASTTYVDDVSFYQRTFTLDESLISTAAVAVSSANTYMVSFYGKRWWWGDGAAVINTKLTVHFYDGAAEQFPSKVVYDGNLAYPDWQQFWGVIYPSDFPTVGVDGIKLEFSRIGNSWIEGWSTWKIPVHYWDMVSLSELADVEALYNLDSHEGRYLPTASISFPSSNAYDNITMDLRLASTGGLVTITDATASQTVEPVDPNTKFVDLAMLENRFKVITIPSHKISGLADKTLIDEVLRVTTEARCIEDLWIDYIAIVPEDRAYSEVRNWQGSDYLILDGRSSNLALISLFGTIDDAQIYDMSNQKGECSFVADPAGFNGTIIVLVNASDTASPPNPTGDYSVTSLVDVTMKYQPYFLLVPES